MASKKLIKFEHFSSLYPRGSEKHPLINLIIQNTRKGPVLDVGCGDGNLLASLNDRFECEGFDPSEISVKKAKERGVNAKVSTIDEFNPKKKFKTIIIMDVLPYLFNHEKDFKKIAEWLDEDGVMLVNICNRYSLRTLLKISLHDKKNFPNYYPTYWEFKKLAKKNGLKIRKSFGGGKFKNFPIFSLAIFYILEKYKK